MKISLSVWSTHAYMYDNSWSYTDFVDFVATTKADGVELLNIFWKDKKREIPLVKEALKRHNLVVGCYGACNNLAVSQAVQRKEQIKDITDSIDLAIEFGAKVVRVFGGDKETDITFEQAKSWIIEGLKEASAYAESKGITLCIENHGYFAGKAEQVIQVIQEVGSPALKSTFDTGNFLLVDDNPNEAIVKLKKYVSHVHFKDFRIVEDDNFAGYSYQSLQGHRFEGVVPGEGSVDLHFILSQLKEAGYDQWLTVEYEGNEEQKQSSIQSIERVQEILKIL